MRKLLVVMLSLFMVSTLAFAKPTTQLEFATLSKADSQFLFKDSAKAVALDNAEMKETKGEWGWLRYGFRGLKTVYRNTRFDGYNGSRIFQVRWKKRPVFRVDYKSNPSPTKLHFHFGNMKKHRPWYAPWKKY